MRRFFLLDSTASGLLAPTCGRSFESSCFDRNGCRIDCEPLLSEAMIADGLRPEIISCISRRTDGRLEVEFPFSGMPSNRLDDCEWLYDECWFVFVLAAKFSADDAADDKFESLWGILSWFWDWGSDVSPSSTIDSLLPLWLNVSTSLKKKGFN